ncbi:dienelactone hydrolase family protein [Nannocystis bainbridge]|uniref:Dienelactone hydrolase family protein n=1 Tax=Nannocystis bainbridge TaxID=2995303 RepID=A0ABT5E3H1_9BACT|nr:dienelactone hydrolase family protein [Nannocystis bainbridge]MDC0720417.1 dienelactone hydrolase family protein [Nannocystis bainbridge]
MTAAASRPLITEFVDYPAGDVVGEAYVAHDGATGRPRPCVVLAHAWDGQNGSIRARAEEFAAQGRVAFALDLYGKGVRGEETGDNARLMMPLLNDRGHLRDRLVAGVAAARQHPLVDPDRLVVIGWCFGGLCALDAARCNAGGVRGVVSIHGVLKPPGFAEQPRITAKILVLHGWEDPVAPPEDVLVLARELTAARADWQLHAYGHAMHAFTFPGAQMPERGLQYDADAARRAQQAIDGFLAEVLGPVER